MTVLAEPIILSPAPDGPPVDGAPWVNPGTGRYHATHPETGHPATFQRASNYAKTVEDTYRLPPHRVPGHVAVRIDPPRLVGGL